MSSSPLKKIVDVEGPLIDLDIPLEKACFIIVKAREFDVKVLPSETDDGSNPADMQQREILEDRPGDKTFTELRDAIIGLNDDEKIDLIALAWVGRGDFEKWEWDEAHALAQQRYDRATTARYLTGLPLLGDYLEEGLSTLGYSCEDFEAEHL